MKISAIPIQHEDFSSRPSIADRVARKMVFRILEKLQGGSIRISDAENVYHFGQTEGDGLLHARISVQHPSFYRSIASRGSIGAGESYAQGLWSTPDLTTVVRIMSRNLSLLESMDSGLAGVSQVFQRIRHVLARNSLSGSRRNIHAHYDLSNDLFAQFLDSRMMYSSAMYDEHNQSLEDAARNKLQRIGEKLELKEGDHVLEIGSGWGGLAVYLAENFGVRVNTTTISEQQYAYAKDLIEEKALQDRITLMSQDYRELEGQFDHLVSVEMIEAVGHQYLGNFFHKCGSLLKPGGNMLIQAITIPEQRYDAYLRGTDFIQRYIFPGGCLPSVEAMLHHAGEKTSLQIEGLEDIGLDYARTLKDWHERFLQDPAKLRELGFDDHFIRLWQFYLCYCEGGFRERAISTHHVLFRNSGEYQ